jgi:ATP-binding cassette, subfamily B, bacterial PglK
VSPLFHEYGILNLLLRLWQHLSRRRKFQFWLVLALMLVSAFMEIVSLGAVLPFLGILVAPDRVFNHPLSAFLLQPLGINSADQLVLPLTIGFIGVALIAGAIRMFLMWVSTRFAFASGTDLSLEIYQRTLFQPYSVHLARNSSEVINGILGKVSHTVIILSGLLTSMSSVLIIVTIMFTLVAINPVVASFTAIGFGLIYGLITWVVRHQLSINSQQVATHSTQVLKALQEGLGGIRDVLLDGTQKIYCDIYRQSEYPLKRAVASNLFVSGSPRYAMEALGITLIAVLAYSLNYQNGGLTVAVPLLGALALGMQRLLPSLQQIYNSWTSIMGHRTSLSDTIQLLEQPIALEALEASPEPLHLKDNIRFLDVSFRYNSKGPWVLDGLNFNIPKGGRIGIVGSTGSGKSTMLDLLMGLLFPTEGSILVDGRSVSGSFTRAWQKAIAHVPQSIFLTDSTLIENIAFGVPKELIDIERVRQSARQAQIADFIEGSVEGGYNAVVGERGIRISGGQRQRIGIARALYKQASVLLFDEATSALDNETERYLMRAITELDNNFTILLIAHRLSTVQDCDMIVELEQGRIVAQGTYEELLENSPSFRRKASVAKLKID